jgi:alkylation response protein AidB-like acyl-CoA dehydrogenase
VVNGQNTLVNNALLRWTNEEQKKRYLPRMAANTCGAYALSEAGSGSDAFTLQTKAELKGSDYVLNGRKLWITNAKEVDKLVFQHDMMMRLFVHRHRCLLVRSESC